MRIAYAFVFYFSVSMVLASIGLAALCIPFIRKMYFKLLRTSGIGKNQYFRAARYLILVIIFLIMIDAVHTYLTFKTNLEIGR